MNNISANFTPSLSVRCANVLKFNPYARTTALVVANIGLVFLTVVGLGFIENKINANRPINKQFRLSKPQGYFIVSAVVLASTLAIKSFFNLPLSHVAAGSISLGSIAAIIVVLEKS